MKKMFLSIAAGRTRHSLENIKNFFLLFILLSSLPAFGQDMPESRADSVQTAPVLPDSVISREFNYDHVQTPDLKIDTTKRTNYWRITERTGEIIPTRPDTFLTDYFNRTNAEGQGISVAYLGNLGLPMESRIFFEREDRSHFMFNDAYSYYMRTPGQFNFINTRIPYSNVSYQRAGTILVREERLRSLLTTNAGKKLNIGLDLDYLYARGYYQSQSAKHWDWVFFGNYLADRHQFHIFVNPVNYENAENGGILNDDEVSNPDAQGSVSSSREIQTQLGRRGENTAWNQLTGYRVYLNYHYNLGFNRMTNRIDAEGDTIKQFIPVSSIIYTFDYKNSKKKFFTNDSIAVADFYKNNRDFFPGTKGGVNDSTSYWSLSNTIALSLREGFNDWAKFDLTVFLTQNFREFTLMDADMLIPSRKANESATYIGGELAKRTGKFFRYNAQGSLGVLGDNLADLHFSGTVETRIPLWGDTASVQGKAYYKNLEPTYYEKQYRSRYFWWDNDFKKIKKTYLGGTIDIPHTKSNFSLGVENVTNYIYFGTDGYPRQHNKNIQIIAAQFNQNFQFKSLHWDNQLVYQIVSDTTIIPLPHFTAYSSLYVQFQIAKVLTIQMGVNAHYWTKYTAQSYDPAIQQFKLQDLKATEDYHPVKVGAYPLLNAFLNCHLKQTRFFVEYYNAGAQFIFPSEYFSIPHYPVNPTLLKLGLSVDFIN